MWTEQTFIADRMAREKQIDLRQIAQTTRVGTARWAWLAGFRGR